LLSSARRGGADPLRRRRGAAVVRAGGLLRTQPEWTITARAAGYLAGVPPALLGAGGAGRVAAVAPDALQDSDVPRRSQRQLLHPARHRRHPVPVPAALPGWPRLLANSVGPADDAAGDCRDEPEADDADHPPQVRLPDRSGLQHVDPRRADLPVRDDR